MRQAKMTEPILYNGNRLAEQISGAREALRALQRPDGHWLFELEADATIPSEYIFLQHYLGEVVPAEERRIATYLRKTQTAAGGWPLFPGGRADLSTTVKAYFALKLAGDDPDQPHMRRAREVVLGLGGAGGVNVFTRISLALFGQIPWRAVPLMPVEIMLLGRRSPFHLSRISYWSRTVIVPLLILMALKPRARNPRGAGIAELFPSRPAQRSDALANPTGSLLGQTFIGLDRALRMAEPLFPKPARQRAIEKALAFIRERLNGDDGLGGIFPAMTNAVMALDALGHPPDHPDMARAKRAIKKLLVTRGDYAYCQPCLSPIWDTALAVHALLEAGVRPSDPAPRAACDWLAGRQITETAGDHTWNRPSLPQGGWAFQYRNDHYPDVDDTAVVAMALHRADPIRHRDTIARAALWVRGMQSRNGGWGAFDADNTSSYLNHIPFADHGALLDPPTADVTARCIGMLAQVDHRPEEPALRRAAGFLLEEQEPDGSWHGRWGVNYVYGTWSALSAFHALGTDPRTPHIRAAVRWIKDQQNSDGGWGESCASYWNKALGTPHESTPSQTAWALLGLMAAGQAGSEAAARGAAFLERAPREGAAWREEPYTGVGFPGVFYLKYHGYSAYFPLWALARYRNLTRLRASLNGYGM